MFGVEPVLHAIGEMPFPWFDLPRTGPEQPPIHPPCHQGGVQKEGSAGGRPNLAITVRTKPY